jgi:hypothetical protein
MKLSIKLRRPALMGAALGLAALAAIGAGVVLHQTSLDVAGAEAAIERAAHPQKPRSDATAAAMSIAALASLSQAAAAEFKAFVNEAKLEPQKQGDVAQILGEHQRHSVSLIGHQRADLLTHRLEQFTRTRIQRLLAPEQLARYDETELPGSRERGFLP